MTTSTRSNGVGYNPNRNDDGTFANGAHTEADLELTGDDHANDAPEPFRLGGLTADEHRAYGRQSRQNSIDSFERSDTDGFASQAAGDLMSSLHARQAEICDDNGMIEVRALFDADGNMVPAKRLQTRYGMAWGVLESDDPSSDIKSWFNESEAENDKRRIATNAKKGFYVGVVKAPGNARIGGGGTGMAGMASCYVQTYRTDGGFNRDVEIVDNGQATEPVVPAAAEVAPYVARPIPREPVPDLGPDPRDRLAARLGDLRMTRQYVENDLDSLRAEVSVDSWEEMSDRAAQEEFDRMCAVVDAVRAGTRAPRTRLSASNPEHLGYRPLNEWEIPGGDRG